MNNQKSTIEITLELRGAHAGKTIELAGHKFVDGEITLKGVKSDVESAARYLGRCYQALEKGSKVNAWGEELELAEEKKDAGDKPKKEKGDKNKDAGDKS